MQDEPLVLDDKRRTQLDKNIQGMLDVGASNDDIAKYATEFKTRFGIKKKVLSDGIVTPTLVSKNGLDPYSNPYGVNQGGNTNIDLTRKDDAGFRKVNTAHQNVNHQTFDIDERSNKSTSKQKITGSPTLYDEDTKRLHDEQIAQSMQQHIKDFPENYQNISQGDDAQLVSGDAGRDGLTKVADYLGLSTLAGGFNSAIYKPLSGASQLINDGVNAIGKAISGKDIYSDKDRRGIFGKLSDDAQRVSENVSKVRQQDGTILGDVYHGVVGTAPLIMGTMMTGGSSAATQSPAILSNLTRYLTVTGALKGYDDARLQGKDIQQSSKDLAKGAFTGALEGVTIEASMGLGKALGKNVTNMLVERGLLKGGEATAKALEALGVGTAFAGTSVGHNIANGEDINWREAAAQMGMGLAFEASPVISAVANHAAEGKGKSKIDSQIIQNIAERGQENKIASFLNATPEQIDGIVKLDKSHDALLADAIESGIKAGESSDYTEKRNGYVAQVGLMNAANIKELTGEIAKDPTKFIEGIDSSDLPAEIKDQVVQKINDVYKSYNPVEVKKTALGEEIINGDKMATQLEEVAKNAINPVEQIEADVRAKAIRSRSEEAKQEITSLVEEQIKPKKESEVKTEEENVDPRIEEINRRMDQEIANNPKFNEEGHVSLDKIEEKYDDEAKSLKNNKKEQTSDEKSYQSNHKIIDTSDNSRLDDITKEGELVPSDIYTKPHYYADMQDKASKESFDAITNAKGKPDAEVTIYRSVPKGISDINNGDWITLSKKYAEDHEQGNVVISKKVKVGDVRWDGNDINEFGYFPKIESPFKETAPLLGIKNEEVIKKAESDLEALKKVENKQIKYEASLKRLSEAKQARVITNKEFDDIKARFDDIISNSTPKVDKIKEKDVDNISGQDATSKVEDLIENIQTTPLKEERDASKGREVGKAGDSLRVFAEKIRSGKINKLGGFKSSTGFDAAWDLGLEAVALSVEGGAKIADAIESGLKAIRRTDWYKKLDDKDDFESQYRRHMEGELSAQSEINPQQKIQDAINKTIGISKVDTANQRAERGLEDVIVQDTKTLKEMFESGKTAIERRDIDPRLLAAEIKLKPRNISSVETNALLYDRQSIRAERESLFESMDEAIDNGNMALQGELGKRLDYLEDLLKNNEYAVKSGARENALALSSMQNMINEDYSLSTQRSRMESYNGGSLSKDQNEELKVYKNKLDEANEKLKNFEKNQKLIFAKSQISEAKRMAKKSLRSKNKEILKKEFDIIIDDFREELRKIRSTQSSTVVPYVRELIAAAPYVRKAVPNLIKRGLLDFNDIVDALHNEFKKHIDQLSKDDVIDVLSGIYNQKKETKNELLQQKDDVFRLAALTKKLKRLQDGLAKQKKERPIIKYRSSIVDILNKIKVLEEKTKIDSKDDRLKQNVENSIERINNRIKSGDFEKGMDLRKTIVISPETIHLKAQQRKAQNNFDAMAQRLRDNHKSSYIRFLDKFDAVKRAFILSGVKTLGKLYAFSALRSATTPIEEILNTANSRIPGLNSIARMSPRYSNGVNWKAEAKAISTRWSIATLKDSWINTLKDGVGELDRLYGKEGVDKDFDLNPSALEFFGRLHGAFKNSTKRAEFFRSFEKRLQHKSELGQDINDPHIQFVTAVDAYVDAKRTILMGDNIIVDQAYKPLLQGLNKSESWTGRTAATFIRTIFPIVKIPTNYVLESYDAITGAIPGLSRATPYVFKALSKGVSSLEPSEADLVMRTIAKGQIGLALLITGYLNPNSVGGYYSGKRDDSDLKAGDLLIGKLHVPHWAAHNPFLEALQVGATLRRALDSADGYGADNGIMDNLTTKNRDSIVSLANHKYNKELSEPQTVVVHYNNKYYTATIFKDKVIKIIKGGGLSTGIANIASGLSEQVPFTEGMGNVLTGLRNEDAGTKIVGDFTRNTLEPRILQEAADFSDRDTDAKFIKHPVDYLMSDVRKREPKNFKEYIKIGVPGLRQQVDIKVDKSLSEIKVDTDTYELTPEQTKERESYIEDYIKKYSPMIEGGMRKRGYTSLDIKKYIHSVAKDYSEDRILMKYKGKNGNFNLKLKD